MTAIRKRQILSRPQRTAVLDQKAVDLKRDIYCCIPACNESEEEVALSLNIFRKKSMPSLHLRRRIHLFIFLDRQRDDEPDTPTFKAYKKLLGIESQKSDNNTVCIHEDGCRTFHGLLEDIPYSLYVKGDNLISGKRYSILLFANVIEKITEQTGNSPSHLLFLDCDTTSTGKDVQHLIDALDKDPDCGGAAGWIRAENIHKNNFIILLQEFYTYFLGHVIEKASDTLFGKCTCLPGAFSVVRYAAFKDCLEEYSRIPNNSNLYEINCLELGEDRYLTTLLVSKGYRIVYVQEAIAKTAVPDSISYLITQQRRWFQSTFFNQIELLLGIFSPSSRRSKWEPIQILVIFFQFLSSLLTVGLVAAIASQGEIFRYFVPPLCIALGVWVYSVAFSFSTMNKSVDRIYSWIIFNFFLLAFINYYGTISIIIYCFEANSVDIWSYIVLFLIILRIVFMVYPILRFSRPKEWSKLFLGFISCLLLGGLTPVIALYSLANVDSQSWGTRGITHENKGASQVDKVALPDLPFVKGNSKWQAAQVSSSITGFYKKLIFITAFFLINLLFIFWASNEENNELTPFICILLQSFTFIPQFLMAFLHHLGRNSGVRKFG